MKLIGKSFIFLLLFHLFGTCAAAVEVRFRNAASVSGEFFTLGDIATLEPAATGLALRTIYRSPLPGKTMTCKTAEIRSYLEQTDSDFEDVVWGGAESVAISRKGITFSAEKIIAIIDRYLAENSRQSPVKNLRMEFTPTRQPKGFTLPTGKLSCRVIPSASPVYQSHSFNLTFSVDGKVRENLAVRGDMKATAPVVVAAVDIPRGTLLTAENIRIQTMNLDRMRDPSFEPQAVVGQKVKRSLRKGVVVEKSMIDFPPLVKRGELITIIARHGELKITATAVARSDGREGDTIRVKNNGSGKEILCKVIGPGQAAVEF